MTELDVATQYDLRTDYGTTTVVVLDTDGQRNAKVVLLDDKPPLGSKGETSWVPREDLTERP